MRRGASDPTHTSHALLIDAGAHPDTALYDAILQAGFEICSAGSDQEGWRAFADRAFRVVVIRLTAELPRATQLIRQIRREAGSWIPILIVVCSDSPSSPQLIFAAGQEAANELLILPEQLAELPHAVRRIANLKVQHLRRRRQRLLYHELRRTLEECDGVIARVADRMGADRTTIYYHLKKFGLY
jgi:DNA-binding NtrC family response regulator